MICDTCFVIFLIRRIFVFRNTKCTAILCIKARFPFLQKHTHSLKRALAKAVTNTKKYCLCLKSSSANLKGGDMSQFAMAFLLLE